MVRKGEDMENRQKPDRNATLDFWKKSTDR